MRQVSGGGGVICACKGPAQELPQERLNNKMSILTFTACIGLLALLVVSFALMGGAACAVLRVRQRLAFRTVTGAFVYFAFFEAVYLPCVFLRKSLTFLSLIWFPLWGVLLIGSAIFVFARRSELRMSGSLFTKRNAGLILAVLAVCLFFSLFALRLPYYGWDTAYYVREMTAAINHNTLYQSWIPGTFREPIELVYALCSYYMLLALLARPFAIPAYLAARIIGGGTCLLLSLLVVYSFGQVLFAKGSSSVADPRRDRNALVLTAVWGLMNLLFVSIYTANAFLMERSYEGKAWCSNVLIPYLLLVFCHLYRRADIEVQEEGEDPYWCFVFLACLSCDTISMSCLIIYPIMLTALSLIQFCREERGVIIRNWLLCCLPLLLYLLVVALNTKGILYLMA